MEFGMNSGMTGIQYTMKFSDNTIDKDRAKSHASAWDLALSSIPDVSLSCQISLYIDNGIYCTFN